METKTIKLWGTNQIQVPMIFSGRPRVRWSAIGRWQRTREPLVDHGRLLERFHFGSFFFHDSLDWNALFFVEHQKKLRLPIYYRCCSGAKSPGVFKLQTASFFAQPLDLLEEENLHKKKETVAISLLDKQLETFHF